MSVQKVWTVNKDNVIRTGNTNDGDGDSKRLYVGKLGSFNYRSFLRFTNDWTGVGRIVSATLVIYTDDQNGRFPPPNPTDKPSLKVQRLSSSFLGGSNADDVFTAGDYTAPAGTSTGQVAVTTLQRAPNGVNNIDITAIVNAWAPPSVKQSSGAPGANTTNYGLRLIEYNTSGTTNWSGWSQQAVAQYRPTIVLTYTQGVTKPNVPTNLTPVGVVGSVPQFQGDFTDTKVTDTLYSSEVEVYDSTGVTRIFQAVQPAGATEIAAARFSLTTAGRGGVPLNPTGGHGGWVQHPGVYKWRARVTDQEGQTSDWTALQTITLTNTNPSPPSLAPAAQSFASLSAVPFTGGTFADADNDVLLAYQVQLSALTSNADPLWDEPSFLLWDTGKFYVPSGSTSWSTQYGGGPLVAGTYHWRARQWDNREGLSAWTYTSITLTNDFDPAPGSQTNIQLDPKAPWRIVIKGMSADGKRGPGTTLAVIENAKSVGAAVVYNSPGELHFTLDIDHPQVSVIEPKQTHYSLQMYGGDGWREVFAGLVWDYDANENSVIFYGIDYLALFDYVFDERFDAANIDLPSTQGGSKYVSKTISQIVSSQLALVIAKIDSPVGFLTLGPIATMSESVTIWSTFAPTLNFVSGLLDSHRQGTGKKTQIKVIRTTSGGYQVTVLDDPGADRPNLRMKYGELVQGYRVIPFGTNWAARQLAIGRERDGVKVRYREADAPGIDTAVWGNIAQVSVFDGVSDENDMIRRTQQAALHAGKLGKQMAIGIRSGVIKPRDGYDLCDSIPVVIQHGVVDTTRFGSGFWTIMGIAWETGDDASTNTVLTLLPREDNTPPNPDLIPSLPISLQPEWQVGWQPPDPASITARFFLDQNTGIVWYRLDDGTYGILIDANPDLTPIPGGHNVILNSGFEMGGYVAAPSTHTWDLAADWNTSRVGTGSNVSTNSENISLTGNTY